MSNLALLALGLAGFLVLAIVVWVLVKPLMGLSHLIDWINVRIGHVIAWGILLAVIISSGNAIVRKVFDTSSNSWLEAQWILFGMVFLLCSPWTLIQNEHIRIDIVSSMLPHRVRSWIDYLGHLLFLIPTGLIMTYTAWPFVLRSWGQNEQSSNAGGLPVYPAKTLVLIGFTMLLAQGLSELIKRTAVIRGLAEDKVLVQHGTSAEQEAERIRQAIEEEAERHQV